MKDKTFCETKGQLDIIPSNVPVVFISYSWDSDEHKAWVKQLSDDLRQKFGIYTILDHITAVALTLPILWKEELSKLIVCYLLGLQDISRN